MFELTRCDARSNTKKHTDQGFCVMFCAENLKSNIQITDNCSHQKFVSRNAISVSPINFTGWNCIGSPFHVWEHP